MSLDNTSRIKTGLSRLAETVKEEEREEQAIEKATSNDMFKSSVMGFISRQVEDIHEVDENELLLDDAQKSVVNKILSQMDEESLEVSDLLRFSEMIAKQRSTISRDKTNRLNALFDILKPTRESSNPLLNNEKEESESEVSNLGSKELQALLKFAQVFESMKNKDGE